jgi:tryptophanyl-tRNA synthetase
MHIGNYLGAFKQFVEIQHEADCVYCVVDMHAITLPKDPAELQQYILDIAAWYIACGLDTKKAILFVQSDVTAHAELAWILTCCSYTGELSRMTQYKAKGKGAESVPAGIFTYPTLMAADILLYDTDVVPVGEDQRQHIELTRDLAVRINNRFGDDTFVVPEGKYVKEGARIMALDDPTAKMSKSTENEFSRISLLDDEDKIRKAIARATTDSEGEIRYDEEAKPGVSNLLNIYSVLTGKTIPELEKQYAGQGYGTFKNDLADVTVAALAPLRERYQEIRASEELRGTLLDGAERANAIAEKVMARVMDRFGLGVRKR